ncbi:MAG: 23S rRNA (pseudouridine(1915)-N(3))-methyltransferase RlmH [Bacteroidales bacterium]|jgi:23S rRNA (pseudouridine1915-N3)-methyltransferase|nr:23S rRNA (pseudouridine(1915)-N(3))-methyltransferase RlmH [Bacteroidales bacterium]
MKITFLWVGKTAEQWLQAGLAEYEKRLKHYIAYSVICVTPKNLPKQDIERQKTMEGDAILAAIDPADELYLLDEHGKMFSSEEMAQWLERKMTASVKNLVLAVGGPYGFSPAVYRHADGQISFSSLTFSHQMIRLLLYEQVYRALTIIKGEAYHHR